MWFLLLLGFLFGSYTFVKFLKIRIIRKKFMDYTKKIDAFSELFHIKSYMVDSKTGEPEIIGFQPKVEVITLFKMLFREQVILYNEEKNSPISLSFHKAKLIQQMFKFSQNAESLLKEYEKFDWFTQQLLKKVYKVLDENNGTLIFECELLSKDSDTIVTFR